MPLKRKKTGVQSLYTEGKIKDDITYLYHKRGSYRRVAALYDGGVNPMTIHRIVTRGEFPNNARQRLALRVQTLAPAPVCARCGIVHVAKKCTGRNNGAGRELVDLPQKAERGKMLAEIYYQLKSRNFSI